jgi:hypothetical protein
MSSIEQAIPLAVHQQRRPRRETGDCKIADRPAKHLAERKAFWRALKSR